MVFLQVKFCSLLEASSPTRDRVSDEAKHELDGEVDKLDRLVGQLRSTKDWVDSRGKRIKDLEMFLHSGGSCSESRQEDGSSTILSSHAPSSRESGSIIERVRVLEAMHQARVLMKKRRFKYRNIENAELNEGITRDVGRIVEKLIHPPSVFYCRN